MKARDEAFGERGQALLEFALTLPLLLLLTAGLLDLGLALWHHSTLAEAVREGTRFAIVHGADSSSPTGPGSATFTAPDRDSAVETVVRSYAFSMDPARLTVLCTWPDASSTPGLRVTVAASYGYVPFTSLVLGGIPFTLRGSSTGIIQH